MFIRRINLGTILKNDHDFFTMDYYRIFILSEKIIIFVVWN